MKYQSENGINRRRFLGQAELHFLVPWPYRGLDGNNLTELLQRMNKFGVNMVAVSILTGLCLCDLNTFGPKKLAFGTETPFGH